MRRFFLEILILFFVIDCAGQQPINNWKKRKLPPEEETYQFANSGIRWLLSLDASGLITAQNKNVEFVTVDTLPFEIAIDSTEDMYFVKGYRTVMKVYNGYLVGINKGEWGGYLRWYSPEGDSSYTITGGKVNQIFTFNSKIFVAEGIPAYGSDYIWEMNDSAGYWKIGREIKLPSSPFLALNYNERMIIITNNDIFFFDGSDDLDFIKKNGFWDTLYPQSAIVLNDDLYVGMRAGVYKINLRSRKERWLMPK